MYINIDVLHTGLYFCTITVAKLGLGKYVKTVIVKAQYVLDMIFNSRCMWQSCAQLDWDVRVILVDLLPFIKVQLAEVCGPQMLEALRKLILQLVPTQSTLVELDAQLEDALHKFHGCR